MATEACTATLTGLTAGDWSLWLNSETITEGTSRQQQTFSATQTISLETKGYRVYVKGTFSEEELPATVVSALILSRPHDNRFYSLAGQPMQPSRPGIYIQNGKKYIF